jgi:hypothetical protein
MSSNQDWFEIGAIDVRVSDRPHPWRDKAPEKAAVSGDFLVNARTGRLVTFDGETLNLAPTSEELAPPAAQTWVNTRTGEALIVEAKPGTSHTWRFGSLD